MLKAGFKSLERILNVPAKISGISADSRNVKKGEVFVAIKGLHSDGHDFINEAIRRGAARIYGENPSTRYTRSGLNYIQVADSREKLGELASEFYGNPSQKLIVIGVTGTKGKTTTCHLIAHILTKLGQKTKLISTITVSGFHTTTPDVISLHKFLKEAVDEGCKYAVVEISSHGIDQKRIAGVKFNVGVLTNIAPEHLDYHKTFAEYKRVKNSFINTCRVKIVASTKTDINILPGKFNNLNAQAAIDTVVALGYDRQQALGTLHSFELPEGRLEEVKNSLGIKIFIDFAHTPNSLRNVLGYLKTKTYGRLIAVFGCAGERDVKKRGKMGQVSGEIADFSVFTAEDPRSENIFDIFQQMKRSAKNFVCIPERGEAIAYALSCARKKDCVVVCGKGHEKSMAYSGFEHPWSDRKVIENFLKRDKNISAIVMAAGKGKRMHSLKPKVLHEICGRPMIAYSLENLRSTGVGEIIIVGGYRKNEVIKRVAGAVKIAIQKNPVGGTADAARVGFEQVGRESKVLLVVNGDDSAFYKPETISEILRIHQERERKLTFVSLIKQDPTGLGRVIRGRDGLITKIVEEKDASDEERKIKEVNDGLYVFDKTWFAENIDKVKKGPQGEYYLVDLIKIAIDQGDRMATYTLPDDSQWQGINTPEQLEEANRKMSERLSGLH